MKRRGVAQRGAMVATGITIAASVGLAGRRVASAAAPAGKIKSATIWTLELSPGLCFHDTFNTTTHRFTSFTSNPVEPGYGKGTWSGGGSSISLVWTKGDGKGFGFSGTFAWKSRSRCTRAELV